MAAWLWGSSGAIRLRWTDLTELSDNWRASGQNGNSAPETRRHFGGP
jgi:hypothetical protein